MLRGISSSSGASGLTLISSGVVTDPVEYYDITLPTDRPPLFSLILSGLTFSNPGQPSFVYSTDGGTTWICDPTNGDSYTVYLTGQAFFHDSIGAIGSGASDTVGTIVMATIYPGTANLMPMLGFETYGYISGAAFADSGATLLNAYATTPPPAQRVNAIRIVPYGNEDAAPPTSGQTLTIDYWALFGLPA
jgi:hypothetical protein